MAVTKSSKTCRSSWSGMSCHMVKVPQKLQIFSPVTYHPSDCTWIRFDIVDKLLTHTRAHICHEYHELYSWRKNCHVEKFQLSMYDNCGEIENFSTCGEISGQLIGFYCNLCRFVAKSVIHAVLSRNFM